MKESYLRDKLAALTSLYKVRSELTAALEDLKPVNKGGEVFFSPILIKTNMATLSLRGMEVLEPLKAIFDSQLATIEAQIECIQADLGIEKETR